LRSVVLIAYCVFVASAMLGGICAIVTVWSKSDALWQLLSTCAILMIMSVSVMVGHRYLFPGHEPEGKPPRDPD
jgi:hypothetical protein